MIPGQWGPFGGPPRAWPGPDPPGVPFSAWHRDQSRGLQTRDQGPQTRDRGHGNIFFWTSLGEVRLPRRGQVPPSPVRPLTLAGLAPGTGIRFEVSL